MEFNEVGLFRGEDYQVNEYITIHHPTLKEIFDYGEQKYWSVTSTICATPSDLKHQLFDTYGFYFNEVDEFDLFCMLASGFEKENIKIFFGDLDFSKLYIRENEKTGLREIFDKDSGFVIDKVIYTIITEYIRKINGLKKNLETAGNEIARKMLIEESRRNYMFNQNKPFKPMLLPMVLTMVNCADFKYNYSNVWDMPLYAFLDSVKRIMHMKNVGYTMLGVYTGNIMVDKLDKKDLDWFSEI